MNFKLFGDRLSKDEKKKLKFEAQEEVFRQRQAEKDKNFQAKKQKFKAKEIKREQFSQANFFQKVRILADETNKGMVKPTLKQRFLMNGERPPAFLNEPAFLKGNLYEGYKKK